MSKKFWCSRDKISKALKAEGFERLERRHLYRKDLGTSVVFLSVSDALQFLRENSPTREDLPLCLAGMGDKPWHQGVKQVLCRLL